MDKKTKKIFGQPYVAEFEKNNNYLSVTSTVIFIKFFKIKKVRKKTKKNRAQLLRPG